MHKRKALIKIKPLFFVLLIATLVLAMSSASAADDGIADDAVIADANDIGIDDVSASSDVVAADTESSDIYSVDDATVTEDIEITESTDANDVEIIENAAAPKAPLASSSGADEKLAAGDIEPDIELSYEDLFGGDVCAFSVLIPPVADCPTAKGTVTVTIIDTCVPEDANPRTFVYIIPVANSIAAAGDATSITIDGEDVEYEDVLLWPYYRNEWVDGAQRFPDKVTIAYSGDDTYAPKTIETTLTVYPFEADMSIDGAKIGEKYDYGEALGLVQFEVYDPFDFNNPYYEGDFIVVILPDSVDLETFDPVRDADKAVKSAVVHIIDGEGSINFEDIFDPGYYHIGIYFDAENFPTYVTWEGFEVENSDVGPFVVSSNGKAYANLEQALEVAVDGDTITVIKEGTYTGAKNIGLDIAKSVTIAAAGTLKVIFDCENNNNFISVAPEKVVVLKDLTVSNGMAEKGGAVYVYAQGRLATENVDFLDNHATKSGGAIYAEDGAYLVIMKSIFRGNIADGGDAVPSGGAIYTDGGFAALTNSIFQENQAGTSAGAIYMGADDFTIYNCNFIGNEAIDGSAGALWVNGWTGKVEGCLFAANEASDFGGAIEWKVKEGTLINSTFEGNKASQGGAIHWFGVDGTIKGDNVFAENEATQNGGAIFWEGAGGTIEGAAFTQNNAAEHGNAIYWAGAQGTVKDSRFESNTGGAGAIIWTGAEGNIRESYFADNGNNPSIFNIYKMADDLNIEANTFEISTASIRTDKSEYGDGETAAISGDFNWGVNDYPINIPITWTKNEVPMIPNIVAENVQNIAFTASLEDLNAGVYTVSLDNFIDNTKSNVFNIANPATATFTVEKITPNISVAVADTDVDEDVIVKVEVTGENGQGIAGIELKGFIDDNEFTFTTGADGKYTYNAGKLSLKNYTAFVVFNGDDLYNSAEGSDDFRVVDTPVVDVFIQNIDYGENALIVATIETADGEDLDGVVEVTLGDFLCIVAVADGYGSLEVEDLDAGTYTYTAKSREIGNYLSAEVEEQTFTVSKVAVTIDSDFKDGLVVYPNAVECTIEAYDENGNPVSGSAEVALYDGEELINKGTFTFEDGKLDYEYDESLPEGAYTLKVTFAGDDNYESAEASIPFSVISDEIYVDVEVNPTEIYPAESSYISINVGYYDVETEEIIVEPVDGTATITIKGVDNNYIKVIDNVEIEEGVGFEEISGLQAGEYEIMVDINIPGYTAETAYAQSNLIVAGKKGTYTDLQNLIDNAVDGVLELPYDFAFDPEYDLANNPLFYNGVVIDQSISIVGNGHTISGMDQARIFYVNEEKVFSISDATLTHGAPDKNGAIYSEGMLTVTNCAFDSNAAGAIYSTYYVAATRSTFTKNAAEKGGAIYVNNGVGVWIAGSTFSDNEADYGGAVAIEGITQGTIIIEGSKFEGNSALLGGAIGMNNNPTATITGCNFTNNKALASRADETGNGGAIIAEDIENGLSLDDCVFQSNTAEGKGGAIALIGDSTTAIRSSEFAKNSAANGGAIYSLNVLTVQQSSFDKNTASEIGGAIYTDNALSLDSDVFNENSAVLSGGALFVSSGKVNVIVSNFTGNKVTDGLGGAISLAIHASSFIAGSAFDSNKALTGSGGAIYINSPQDNQVFNSQFNRNTANYGGAILVDVGGSLSLSQSTFFNNIAKQNGGAIFTDSETNLYVRDTTFTKNLAEGTGHGPSAGAVFVGGDGADILDSNFIENTGENSAGAIYWDGDYGLLSGNFTGNYANTGSGGAVFWWGNYGQITGNFTGNKAENGFGGAITIANNGHDTAAKNVVINPSTFTGNKAAQGGAVYVQGEDSYINGGAFEGNEASQNGGAIFIEGNHATVTNSNFTDNKAGESDHGNAIYWAGTQGTVEESRFESNTGGAGAIIWSGAEGNIKGSYFADNGNNPSVFNIYKLADDLNIEANTFEISTATIRTDKEEYEYDETATVSGQFNWGVNDYPINLPIAISKDGVAMDDIVIENFMNVQISTAIEHLTNGLYAISIETFTEDGKNNKFIITEPVKYNFVVDKGTPTITVAPTEESFDYGDDAVVEVTVMFGDVPVSGNAVVTVNNVDYAVAIGEDGKGTLTIKGLPFGEYPIAAEFLGNDNFEAAEYDGDAKVVVDMPTTVTFDISIENITYGESLVVVVENVKDAAGNLLSGTVMGNIENATGQGAGLVVYVTDGRGTRTISGLTAGDYDVSATFVDDEYEFFSETKEFTINVAKASPVIAGAYADGKLTITLDGVNGEKLNETVAVTIDGVAAEAIETQNGTYGLTLDLAPGKHIVDLAFEGNHNYVAASTYTSFDIEKLTPTVTVSDASAEWNTSVSIPVTVMYDGAPVEGIVIVTVDWEEDGITDVVELVDGAGEASFTIDQTVGECTITARYVGNDVYNEATATATLTITESTDLELEVTANEVEYGEDAIITIVAKDGRGADVPITKANITVNGETVEMDVAEDGTVNLGKLPAGDTEVTVSVDDGVHELAKETVTVSVEPASGVQVAIDADDYGFYEKGKAYVTVTDYEGEPISGKLSVLVNGETYGLEIEVGEDGKAVVELKDLPIGQHVIEVIFSNENYLPSSNNDVFNVTKVTPTVSVEDKTTEWGIPVTIPIAVEGVEGYPATGIVVVTVDWGEDHLTEAFKLEDGIDEVTFTIDQTLGDCTVTVRYVGDENYTAATATATLTITEPNDLVLEVTANEPEYGEDLILTINGKDGRGADVPISKVNITIDGITDEIEVGEDGTISLKNVPAGTMDITISVDDGVHDFAEETITVTVEPASGVQVETSISDYAFYETGKLLVAVTDFEGNPISGQIAVEINGEIYAMGINVGREGSVEVELNDLPVGEYVVEVTFSNDNYLPSSKNDEFKVTKVTPTVSVEDKTAEWGIPVTIPIAVEGVEGYPATGFVVVTVDWGTDHLTEAFKLEDDIDEVSFTIDQVGDCTVTVEYVGDENYTAATATATLTVNPSTGLELEVTANEVEYGEDAIITIVAKDGSGAEVPITKANITINGETVEMDVAEDGTINLGKLPAGDTEITVKVDDGVHEAAENKVTVSVEPARGVQVTIEADDYAFYEKGKADVTVTDFEGNPISGMLSVLVNGETYTLGVLVGEDGKAVVELKDLPVGQHVIEVIFSNDNYLPSSNNDVFNVTKVTPTINVEDKTTEWGIPVTIPVAVEGVEEYPATGFVVVTVDWGDDHLTEAFKLEDGIDEVTFTIDQTIGDCTVTVEYVGDENYTAATATATLTVTESTELNVEVTDNSPVAGQDLIITVTATDGRGAEVPVTKVNVTIDGGEPQEVDVDENGNVNLGKLPEGPHTVVIGVNDGVHQETTVTKEIVVNPTEITPTEIAVTVENVSYGAKPVIEFTFKDMAGNPLGGTLNVTVADKEYSVTVGADGKGTLEIPDILPADTYPVVAVFAGNKTHAESTGTAYFNIAKNATMIIFENMKTETVDPKVDGRIGEWFYFTLKDVNGRPIANTPMEIGFNGVVYTFEKDGICTDENGVAKLQINLGYKGDYTFAICYLGNQSYNASFVVAKISVSGQTPTITVPNKSYAASAKTKTLTATFKNEHGKLLVDKWITFTVNGKTYKAKTNDKGVASVNVTLSTKGTYTVVAKWGGDSTYDAVNKTATLKIT